MKAVTSMRPRSSTLFAAFAALAVTSTVVSLVRAGIGEHAHERFASGRARATARCAALRGNLDAPPSDPFCSRAAGGLPMFQELRLGDAALQRAKTKEGSDRDRAALLVSALDHADRVERHDTPIASLAAARLYDGVANVIDGDRRLLADDSLAAALQKARFDSSKRPFATMRLRAEAELGSLPGRGRIPDASLARAAAGAAMLGLDDVFGMMQAHVLAGDVAECRRVADTAGTTSRVFVGGGGVCANAASVVRAGRRLDAMRTASSVAATRRARATDG